MSSVIIVPVSGGKDSQLVLMRALDHSNTVIPVYQDTGFDHPLVHEHLRYIESSLGVQIVRIAHPRFVSVPDLFVQKKVLASVTVRVCTDTLKKQVFFKWLFEYIKSSGVSQEEVCVHYGMRLAESPNRRKNYQGLVDVSDIKLGDINRELRKGLRDVAVRLPILELTTPSVFYEIRKRGMEVCSLYHRGHKRVGCYPCVFASSNDLRLVRRDPVGIENLRRLQDAVDAVVVIHKDARLPFNPETVLLRDPDPDPFGFEEGPQCFSCA